MPFKPNDPKTREIASKGAKAKNKKYPEHYRRWLFKKGDPRTKEMSRKAVLARHEKHHEKPEKIFVFIDSITTVLLYNHLPRTIRFSQFLTQKLKSLAINGIMVSVAAGMTSERLIEEIKNFCDEVIDINI